MSSFIIVNNNTRYYYTLLYYGIEKAHYSKYICEYTYNFRVRLKGEKILRQTVVKIRIPHKIRHMPPKIIDDVQYVQKQFIQRLGFCQAADCVRFEHLF